MALARQHLLRKGRSSEVGRPYLLTMVCHDRKRVFDSLQAGRCFAVAIDAMADDADTWCWVAMPDHVHWLMAPGERYSLSRCVQKLKSFTTRCLRQSGLADDRPIWQRGFHDRALRREDDLRAMARYVIANPERAGLVDSVGAWPFWGAAWV